MSGMVEAFFREINDAGLQLHEIARIRITHDAISGAPVAAPLTPERARTVTLPQRGGQPVPLELVREIVVHPDDWRDLLVDERMAERQLQSEPDSIYGLPVVNESEVQHPRETR